MVAYIIDRLCEAVWKPEPHSTIQAYVEFGFPLLPASYACCAACTRASRGCTWIFQMPMPDYDIRSEVFIDRRAYVKWQPRGIGRFLDGCTACRTLQLEDGAGRFIAQCFPQRPLLGLIERLVNAWWRYSYCPTVNCFKEDVF